MLSLLKGSYRSESIQVVLKALGAPAVEVAMVDAEPEFIYVNGDVKISAYYDVLKQLAAESDLYGKLEDEKKQIVDEWLTFCRESLEVPVSVMVWLADGRLTREQVPVLAEKKARADVMLGLRKLELRLKEVPYLAGETMTIADIVIASCLRSLFMLVFGEVERKNSPSMSAWVTNLYSSPLYMETVGETVMLVSNKKGKKN